MKWENFQESQKELPEVIVEKMISGFSTATNELAELRMSNASELALIGSKLKTRFQFRVQLLSNRLPDYALKVFEFGYNVDIYPVKIILTPSIMEELNNKGEGLTSIISLDDQERFQRLLELVFSTARFKEVVGGLMKIARKSDLPF